ncbi:MAG: DUF924 family protein [Bdellovibrionota bacterium]
MNWKTLHEYWFGKPMVKTPQELNQKEALWFGKNQTVDHHIQTTFAPWLDELGSQTLQAWEDHPSSLVTKVILMDQVPRNAFRDTPRMYAYDPQALALTLHGIDRKIDLDMNPIEALFFYLPLEHAEDPMHQTLCVEKHQQLLDRCDPELRSSFENHLLYAHKHKEIIDQFGRFPHRNGILHRKNTPEEIEFLSKPGSSF